MDLDDQLPYDRARAAAASVRAALPPSLHRPHVAIVCGSGLGGMQDTIQSDPSCPRIEIPYRDIPFFPNPTVQGHEGKLVFGFMGERLVPVVLLVGRVHFYEGHAMELVGFATRLCRCLDARILILTNAAGALNQAYRVGDIMLLADHINFPGLGGAHPLQGPNEGSMGPRFPPLSDAYDLDLRRRAHRVWAARARRARLAAQQQQQQQQAQPYPFPGSSSLAAGRSGTPLSASPTPPPGGSAGGPPRALHEGTYAYVAGPTYETRAEARFLAAFADTVGMSTVPEVIVARHAGLRVLAASLVTNRVLLAPGLRGDDPAIQGLGRRELEASMARGRAGHEEVVAEGARAAEVLVQLIAGVVDDLAGDEGVVGR